MIRVDTMSSAKKLLMIIVLSSVKLVMTSQPSETLDDQHQILSSTIFVPRSVQQHPDQKKVLIKRGLTKHIYLKPFQPNSDFDYDNDNYNLQSAVENYIR
jgi:hypothetical protein